MSMPFVDVRMVRKQDDSSEDMCVKPTEIVVRQRVVWETQEKLHLGTCE